MPKRSKAADTRRFFDEFESVRVSRFRALGTIDPAKSQAVVPFPNGKSKLLGVQHVKFPNGGGWSFFLCPGCKRRSTVLYVIDDAARCRRCCDAMNIKYRIQYGCTTAERLQAREAALERLRAKALATTRLRLKPNPPHWRGQMQILAHSQSLTERMRRTMVALRLQQLADQATSIYDRTVKPRAELVAIPEVKQVWQAKTFETLEQALDSAQELIIHAMDHEDPQVRLNAAKLMLRSKQGRDRGFTSA